MNKEDLFLALENAEDGYLEETAAELTPKKKSVWPRVGALAACVALVAASMMLWKPWETERPIQVQNSPVMTAPVQEEPREDGILPEQTDAIPSYTFPALDFSGQTSEMMLDVGPQKGYFEEELTQAQIAEIWDQETLNWEGYVPKENSVTGSVTYNNDGSVWMVNLRYLQYGSEDNAALVISLSPKELPPTCISYDEKFGELLSVEGYVPAEVVASGHGDYRRVTFLRGEGDSAVGVMVEGYYGDYEELITRIVGQSLREDGVLQLSHLVPEEIPYWRSESLTEEQALAEDGLGCYLPADLPDGYQFEEGYREIGQNRDWLSVFYRKGVDNLGLSLYPNKTPTGLVHADEVEKYDLSLFGEKPDVPPELYSSWSCPTFYADELTLEVVDRRIQIAQTDEGEHVFTNFSVLFEDGTVMDVQLYAPPADVPALLSFLLH